MSSVEPGSLVLITGVNGHVASSIAHRLLQQGYRVRGTVRSLTRAAYVAKSLSRVSENFEIVQVTDIVTPGGFDAVVRGVDAVIHTASPVTMDAKKPEEQYVPAIEGTLNILRSAHKTPTVKRVLFLGSIGSVVMTAKDPAKEIITRDDWNIMSEHAVKNLEDPFIGLHIYLGSKLQAEKAAWAFISEQMPSFSLTTILGALVIGPIYKDITGPPREDVTLGQVYNTLADPPHADGVSPMITNTWVHSEDVADLFLASLTSRKTGGKRLLGCAGKMSWLHAMQIVREVHPDRPYPPEKADAPCLNFPGAEVIKFDTALEEELLGGKWRSLEDAMLTCARDLIEKESKGWDKV